MKQQMPRSNSFLPAEGKLVCRVEKWARKLILRAARDRLLGDGMPLRAPKAFSGCRGKKVLEEEQSGKEDVVWLTLQF